MKLNCRAKLIWFAALLSAEPSYARSAHSQRASVAQGENPLTRTVKLLTELRDHADEQHKKEETLYEKFVCWGKSVISQKTMSNAEAEAELGSLRQYVADLESGRGELTSERVDLEKEIASLLESLETAEAARKQENADYRDAVFELQQGVDALKSAIDVLSTATADMKEGVLLDLKTSGRHSEVVDAKEGAALSKAMQLGDKFLREGDATFLRRVLGGEVPEWDWNTLNGKATFKMSYKARSTKIQGVLVHLLSIFEANLAEAEEKEAASQDLYDKLIGAKTKEKEAAKAALRKMTKEGSMKGKSKADMDDRIELLEAQLENDEKYINQVTQTLSDKKVEWQEREALRSKEVAAISEAIEILSNDNAKDLFKRSYASHNYLFVQTSLTLRAAAAEQSARGAVAELRAAAAATHDKRLLALASRAANASAIAEVITAVDDMVQMLADEQAKDDEMKESCESNRSADTRSAVLAGREIDEFSDTITKLSSDVADLEAKIKQKGEDVAAINEQIAAAHAQRSEEHAAFLQSQKDDKDAASTVAEALTVLQTFYEENGLVFVQGAGKKGLQPVEVVAGKAPPPPPKTWDEPYKGRTQESKGIIAILTMLKEDIFADKARAEKAEDKAVRMYEDTKTTLGSERLDLGKQIDDMVIAKGDKEGLITNARDDRTLKKDELDALLAKIKATQPGCDYFTVNYAVRKESRQVELDGLYKARAILQGAHFDRKDPSREMRPGDAALLARARKHLQSLDARLE